MTTIKDIARALDLSPATVSRALNGFPEVNANTRDRVEKAAQEMKYRPNLAAQRLVGGQSKMVGLIFKPDDFAQNDPSLLHMVSAFSSALIEVDFDLIFHVSNDDDVLEPYKRMIARSVVDGFIINAPVANDPRIEYLTKLNVPFVVHGRDQASPNYPFYDIDNHAAALQATELLCNFGHRRIAYIGGPASLYFAHERHRGFYEVMNAFGHEALVFVGPNNAAHGYQTASKLFDKLNPPTAIVASSMAVAHGIYVAAREHQIRIGCDLSVISHDDVAPDLRAKNFEPALTVTRAPIQDAAGPIARLLFNVIAGEDISEPHITQPVELIVRQSAKPLKG